MKVYVQVVDTISGISQNGMIEERVMKDFEIQNALKHFGVEFNDVKWYNHFIDSDINVRVMTGLVEGTSRVVNVFALC